MTAFEEASLFCDHEFALIPGPLGFDEPFYSVAVQEIAEYRAIDVIQTFSALNNVTLLTLPRLKPGGSSAS
jgi:hypothetical protein